MSSSLTRHVALCALAFAAACGDAPEVRLGEDLTAIQFQYFDPEEGVHPSRIVLENPNNPFTELSIGTDAKFEILGSEEASNAAKFYVLATALANEATGENQLFAAEALRGVYDNDEVDPDDRGRTRELVIAAFQSVLDNFPETLLFDEDGRQQSVNAATSALTALIDMGAEVEGGWVIVDDVAVRTEDTPREEFGQ